MALPKILLAGVWCLQGVLSLPTQVHLAYGSTGPASGGMTVSWMTSGPTFTSLVYFGLTRDSMNSSASGNAIDYLSGTGFHHHVTVSNLDPGTTYFYFAGDLLDGFSSVETFTTSPAAGEEFPFEALVVGDVGVYNSRSTLARLSLLSADAAFVWHLGNVGYADDAWLVNPLAEDYERTWNWYMDNVTQFAARQPYMVLPGSHEAECHSPACLLDRVKLQALSNFSAFRARFRMPAPESGSTAGNMWYAWSHGSVRFISVDTETDFPGAPNDGYVTKVGGFGPQLTWLEWQLADAANARQHGSVSWIIVGGHRPIYSRLAADAAGAPAAEAKALQAALEPLFLRYGVDVYVCGHEDSFEVSWPVANTSAVVTSYQGPPFPVYVVSGAGGSMEGHESYAAAPVTAWGRFADGGTFGLSSVRFESATKLTWTTLRSGDGAVLDAFELQRKA